MLLRMFCLLLVSILPVAALSAAGGAVETELRELPDPPLSIGDMQPMTQPDALPAPADLPVLTQIGQVPPADAGGVLRYTRLYGHLPGNYLRTV